MITSFRGLGRRAKKKALFALSVESSDTPEAQRWALDGQRIATPEALLRAALGVRQRRPVCGVRRAAASSFHT